MAAASPDPAVEGYLAGHPGIRPLYDAVRGAVTALPASSERASKSQIGFWRRREFAAVWCPADHLRGASAPLVLTVFLRRRLASERWKEVVEPAPGRFTHHLELWEPADVDEQVRGWLHEAWSDAV